MFQRDWLRALAAVSAAAVICSANRARAQDVDAGWLDGGEPSSGEQQPPEANDHPESATADPDQADREVPSPPPPHSTEDLEGVPEETDPVRVFEPEEFEEADPASYAGATEVSQSAPPPRTEPGSPNRRYTGPPTLLGTNGPTVFGGYGGVDVRWSRIAHHDALLVGGEGALLLDHRLAIGVGGYGLTNLIQGPRSASGNPSYLGLGYGGVVVRHNFVNERLVYLSIGALVGAGGVGFFEEVDDYEYEFDEDEFDADPFFVVEPSLGLDLNVTRWMRVGASISYRLTEGIDCEGLTDTDLRGPAAGGHVQFGWF